MKNSLMTTHRTGTATPTVHPVSANLCFLDRLIWLTAESLSHPQSLPQLSVRANPAEAPLTRAA